MSSRATRLARTGVAATAPWPANALAIDATAGNGHDTVFLAGLVGPAGRVVGFDLQAAAIESAQNRLRHAGLLERVSLHTVGHENMEDLIGPPENLRPVTAVMFNLGYLPGGDKRLTTRTETTLHALEAAARLLAPGGVLSVVGYTGHPGGGAETAAVQGWLREKAGRQWACFHAPPGSAACNPPLPFLAFKPGSPAPALSDDFQPIIGFTPPLPML